MNSSLAHLDPALHELAGADSAARIRMINKDLFIEHDFSQYLNDILATLMAESRHGRMPCWLITGDAGMGKTAQLRRFSRRYPDSRTAETGTLLRPIVVVNTPPEPTRATLEMAVLDALNAPPFSSNGRIDRPAVIRRLFAAHQTRVLVFDEIQHLCHSRSRERAIALDTIKAISTTCQINVVCAGTPAVVREFRADAQLERRFSMAQFTQWKAGPELQRFLATYERARPLRLPSRLSDPDSVRALLAEAGGITHKIIQCLNAAAAVAAHEGIERITPDLLSVHRTEPGRVLAARGGDRDQGVESRADPEPATAHHRRTQGRASPRSTAP